MIPEQSEVQAIETKETFRKPDLFETLPKHAANALFLPPVSAKIISNGVTRIDEKVLSPENPYFSRECINADALFRRLITDFRFGSSAEAQLFHQGLGKLVLDKEAVGLPLLEAYKGAVNRDDFIGPMKDPSVQVIQQALEKHLVELEGEDSAFADHNRAEIKQALNRLAEGKDIKMQTGDYNCVVVEPGQIMGSMASEHLEQTLGHQQSSYVYDQPKVATLAPSGVLDHYEHPDLHQIAEETQQRLRGLGSEIANKYPYGLLVKIADHITAASAVLPSERVAQAAVGAILDLEYTGRSAQFWQDWKEKGLPMCTPKIDTSSAPRIEIVNAICPSLALLPDNERPSTIVPQTIKVDADHPIFVLAGGPDHGKSTTLRSAAQAVVLGLQGQFVTAESSVLSPIADLVVGMRVAREPERGSSHRQEMQWLGENFFSRVQKGEGSVVLLLDDFGQRTGSRDGVAILCSVLDYCQKRGVLTFVATNVNSAPKYFEPNNIKAQVRSLDTNHQMREELKKAEQ